MAWVYTYDTSTPVGSTDKVPILDDRIREVKSAIQERENVDHYWPLSGTQVSDTTAGKHRKVQFYAVLGVKPPLSAGEGALYLKTVSGVSEVFYEDSAGTEKQLTLGGKLNIVAADIAADLINETKILLQLNEYLKGSDGAGGEVALIATDGTSAVLAAGAKLPLAATITNGLHITHKTYVDAQKPDVYDSGWFAASGVGGNTYTKAHGLAAIPEIVQCFYSDTSDGTGDVVQVGAAAYLPGTQAVIVDVDATNVVVRVAAQLASYYDASGVGHNPTSGYLKVVAVKFN